MHYKVTKINRSVGSVLEFQQNEPQNREEFVTLLFPKRWNYLVIYSSSRRVNFRLCRNNGQPQELGDCDLCVEFTHFLSICKTLERKKKAKVTKNKTGCLAIILPQMYPLFHE